MTEVAELSHQALSSTDLLKPPHGLIVFPEIIKSDPRWQQLPPGNIVYTNATSSEVVPDTVLMLDQDGNPEYMHGHIWERSITEPQRTPAVVIHTGPRTPENSYDELIAIARTMTTRTTETDSDGVKHHHQGYVIIVEDRVKDGDKVKEWRKLQLTNLNLVAEDGQEVVVETDDHFITFGRVEKEHVTPPYIKARLENERNNMPLDENPTEREKRLKDERNRALVREFKKNGRLPEEELPDCCGDCGQHYKYVYYQDDWEKPQEHTVVELLKAKKVCKSGLHRGIREIRVGKPDKIGYLGSHPYRGH